MVGPTPLVQVAAGKCMTHDLHGVDILPFEQLQTDYAAIELVFVTSTVADLLRADSALCMPNQQHAC
jgi:hypothetical protein